MSAATFATIDPATEEQIQSFAFHAASEIEAGLVGAQKRRPALSGSCLCIRAPSYCQIFPVGGVKNSGYGRELAHFGAHAFVNAQAVWIENR